MARKQAPRGERGTRSWLDLRKLVLLETVLLVGLVEEMAEDGVLAWDILHPLVRVLLAIGLVVGAFGGMVLVFEQYVHRGIERTHDVVRRLPIPVPMIGIHVLVLLGIFLGYAWWWDARTGALHAIEELAFERELR
jgi:hypothetical protein